MKAASRRQAYANETREAILTSAGKLFCQNGFSATSLDAVAGESGLTKGAVYHHFRDKRSLFESCFERQAMAVAAAVEAVPVSEDAWATALAQCDAFLDFVVTHGAQTVPLQEVISVLGWERWYELDCRHTIGHIQRTVARLQTSGEMKDYPSDIVVRMIYGMLVDAAMTMSTQSDVHRTRQSLRGIIRDMLMSLKAPT